MDHTLSGWVWNVHDYRLDSPQNYDDKMYASSVILSENDWGEKSPPQHSLTLPNDNSLQDGLLGGVWNTPQLW